MQTQTDEDNVVFSLLTAFLSHLCGNNKKNRLYCFLDIIAMSMIAFSTLYPCQDTQAHLPLN